MTPNTLYRPATPGVTYRDDFDLCEYVPHLGMVRLCNDDVVPLSYASNWIEVTE